MRMVSQMTCGHRCNAMTHEPCPEDRQLLHLQGLVLVRVLLEVRHAVEQAAKGLGLAVHDQLAKVLISFSRPCLTPCFKTELHGWR